MGCSEVKYFECTDCLVVSKPTNHNFVPMRLAISGLITVVEVSWKP